MALPNRLVKSPLSIPQLVLEGNFVIISANTPGLDMSKALEEVLNTHGYTYYKCEGQYKGTKETSYLIPTGTIISHLLMVARVHKQESIVVGTEGNYQLWHSNGHIVTSTTAIAFYVHKKKLTGDYTKIVDSPFSFQFDFNW